MVPKPWSHSALEDFMNCARAYAAKRVFKTVVEETSDQMLHGLYVHKAFENWQNFCTPTLLPDDLVEHEPFMLELSKHVGEHFVERKVALNKQLQPCEFFAKDVWWRGIIDFTAIAYQFASIVDYKTGKQHGKSRQLKENALWVFAAHPDVKEISTRYYWTKTQTTTGEVYRREQIPALWAEIVPDLKLYLEAFKTDTWKPKPSGLCYGWCPVTDCEYWRPKKLRNTNLGANR